MWEKIKNILWRWNLKEEQLEKVMHEIQLQNYKIIQFIAFALFIVYLFLLLISLYVETYAHEFRFNLCFVLWYSALLYYFKRYKERCVKKSLIISYFIGCLGLLFGIYEGVIIDVDHYAQDFNPSILLIGCMFIDRPLRIGSFLAFFTGLFIAADISYKTDLNIILNDCIYSSGYAVGAILLSYFISKMRVEYLYREYEIREIKMQAMALKLENTELDLMHRQIQPHFIFNTLAAISGLCKVDGESAEKMVNLFAKYLRNNIDALGNKRMVSLDEELSNVLCYLDIVSIRYQENFGLNLDLQARNFQIPIFSLQPLVENAVKHGLVGTQGEKAVTISTVEENGCYHICVEDEGRGFELKKNEEGYISTGIKNVAFRLEKLAKGRMEIHSEIGKGTKIDIYIPAGGTTA